MLACASCSVCVRFTDTVAYSGHCETDQDGRPIAAHFNWAPSQLPYSNDEWMIEYLVRSPRSLSRSLSSRPLGSLTHTRASPPALSAL